MTNRPVEITFLGHATFLLKGNGKNVLIDPWLRNNPACPKEFHDPPADIVLITHGHFDHIGDAVELARRREPQVVANYETAAWLEGKGVKNTVAMNKGGTVEVGGIRVTMVSADHSCGILDDGKIVYGGDPAGFVIEYPDGPYRVYHAGDTNVFTDMKLIGELYRPDLALLPIGDHFTMGPREAALAIRLLGVKEVVPMHYGTFPVLTGTPAALREQAGDVAGLKVHELQPGGGL